MRKIIMVLLACMILAGSATAGMAIVQINEANFPDKVFRNYVSENFDTNKDGILSNNEILNAKSIYIWGTRGYGADELKSLQGIKYLTSLESLNCGCNGLKELDLSGLTSLVSLSCSENKLTSLNLTGCSLLLSLSCSDNKLTSLNLTDCVLLQNLYCNDNALTELDISTCTEIRDVYCQNNIITALDVSKNETLACLICYNNRITALDISKNLNLSSLSCYNNRLVMLNVLEDHSSLWGLECTPQHIDGLTITPSGGKYTVNLRSYLSVNVKNVAATSVYGKDSAGDLIYPAYNASSGVMTFDVAPESVFYEYDTQYTRDDTKRNMEVTIAVSGTPVITTESMPAGKINESYEFQFEAKGEKPITWTFAGTIPGGLYYDENGKISGTPYSSAEGTYVITVTATNDFDKETRNFVLNIAGESGITKDFVWNGHRYRAYSDVMTWDEAKAYCERLGGHLVSITSQEEQDLVVELVKAGDKAAYWLGGRCDDSGVWSWVDGSEWDYTDWDTDHGEPNGSGNCLQIYAHVDAPFYVPNKWDDTPSDASEERSGVLTLEYHGFVCEWDNTDPVPEKPSITTAALPDGESGTFYGFTLEASGTDPITWTVSGLPGGLTADSSTGEIIGTPTTAGTFTVTVTASNTGGEDSKTFTLTVSESAPAVTAPAITTTELPSGTSGTAYSATLTATGDSPITWAATGLPSGLAADSSTGTITGTPAESGTFTVTVTATNSGGSDSKTFTLTISEPAPTATAPAITTAADLGTFTVGDAVSVQLLASGTTPITWTHTGGNLPSGVTLGNTGLLSGTVNVAGTYSFTVIASNPAGNDSRSFTITVNEPAPAATAPAITTTALPAGTAGTSYTTTLTATGTAPVTWTAVGLPDGLSMSTAGVITGTPALGGKYTVTVTATNTMGNATRIFTLAINSPASAAIAPTITTTTIPAGTAEISYSVIFAATGTAQITWAISGLPDEFSISDTGRLTGTAKTAGTYDFTVTATNAAGSDTRTFTLTIGANSKLTPPKIATTSLADATEGQSYTATLTAEGSGLTWSATGLPSGLTVSKEGTISGTPSKAGTYRAVFTVKNSAGVDSIALTLTVNAAPSSSISIPTVKTSKLPDGFIGEEYSYQLEAEGEVDTWRNDGELPAGLELDETTGEISGLITTASAKSFKLKIVAVNEAGESNTKSLTLKVSSKKIGFKTDTLNSATFGKSYSFTVKPLNLKATMWSVEGDLPAGIKFDKGKFSGKPQEVGDFDLTVTASNGAVDLIQEYTLTVKGIPPKLTGSFKTGSEGAEYNSVLKAKGTTPIEWEIDELPDGLDYVTDATGETCTISGVPTKAFSDRVAVTITNGETDEDSLTKNMKLTIKSVKPAFNKKKKPDNGTVGVDYYFEFELSKKPVELEWEYTGSLPDGLTFEDGIIEGIPEESGTFKFAVIVRNANKTSDKATWSTSIRIMPNTSTLPGTNGDNPETDSEPEFVNGVAYYERGGLSAEILARAANSGEIIAAILPAIEVDEEGMYDFTVSLDQSIPEGATLVWHSYPDGGNDPEDTDSAIFLDEDGEITEYVPETYSVTVSAWLKPGIIYEPIITVKR